MTDELEKLQRKGTKPTCPHCHASILSTSQPNLMGTTPELQKMYDEFGGENLPNPETMLAYASILEKPQYWIDPKTGRKYQLATGEIVEAACAALRHCAALAATPAVGGEREALAVRLGHMSKWFTDQSYEATTLREARDALAAPPASPLRELEQLREWKSAILGKCKHSDGFDSLEWGGDKEGWGFVHYFIGHLNTRALHAETILAEQPASPLRGRGITNLMVERASLALMNTFIKKWFLGSYKGPVYLDCVNGEKSWEHEARAALTAALSASPPEQPAAAPVFQCPDCGKDIADPDEPHATDCGQQDAAVKMYRDALAVANVRIAELEDRLSKAAFATPKP